MKPWVSEPLATFPRQLTLGWNRAWRRSFQGPSLAESRTCGRQPVLGVSSLLVLMSPAPLEHIHPARAHVETPLGDPFIKCCKEDVSSMGTRPGSAGERRSFSNLSNSLGRVLSAGAPRRLWRRETGGTQGTGWEWRARTSFPAGHPSGGWRMGARGRKAPAISSRARRAHAVGSPCTHAWLGMSRRQGERPWGTQVTRMPYAAAVAV